MNSSLADLIKKNKQHNKKKFERKEEGKGYMIPISNLHWNVTDSDLKQLFGDSVLSIRMKYDNSGRSEGKADVVFSTLQSAQKVKDEFDGQPLDGHNLQFGMIKEWQIRKKKEENGPKSSVFDRLAPKIEDRLGQRIGDRLGPKLEDRLGKKMDDRLGKKKNAKPKKKATDRMETDPAPERPIKSYADTEIAVNDGALI
jgi:THO complex subunit 4